MCRGCSVVLDDGADILQDASFMSAKAEGEALEKGAPCQKEQKPQPPKPLEKFASASAASLITRTYRALRWCMNLEISDMHLSSAITRAVTNAMPKRRASQEKKSAISAWGGVQ